MLQHNSADTPQVMLKHNLLETTLTFPMRHLIPPLCLFLALAMLIAGFAIWAVESPQAKTDLHAARASGDDALRDVLEAQLHRQQLARKLLLGCLFGGSVLMVVLAFLSMRPAGS